MVFLVHETAGQGVAQDGTGTAWWSEIGGGEGAGESSGRRCPCPLSPHCEKFEIIATVTLANPHSTSRRSPYVIIHICNHIILTIYV